MNKNGVGRIVAAILVAVCGFGGKLVADDSASIDLLCSAPWQVIGEGGGGWARIRIFQKDGTFTTQNVPIESGSWSISGNTITLVFNADKHTDIISLPLDPKGTAGTDAHSRPITVVKLPPPPPPPTPEIQQKTADLISAHQATLVLVSGNEGMGGGFMALMGKSNFLVTTTHLIAGLTNPSFKTLDNTVLKIGAASVAVSGDVFCMAQPAGGAPLEIMQDVDKNVAVGDDVAVLANSEGEGVLKTFTGQVLGIEPDRVEVNAAFATAFSGSPIIHLKTGKVIGIAGYIATTHNEAGNLNYVVPIMRHYAMRLDIIKSWQNMDWQAFHAQALEMNKIETTTKDLGIFIADVTKVNGAPKMETYTSQEIASCFYRWQQDLGPNPNAAAQGKANRNLVYALKTVSQSDVTAARQHITYDYFQRQLAQEQKARDDMAPVFKQLIEKYGQ